MNPEEPGVQNPYAAPNSEVSLAEAAPEVPTEVLGKIRGAWVAGAVSTAITLLLALGAIQVAGVQSAGLWHLIDMALLAILTFGIYRRSRVCAVLMVVLFLISRYIVFQAQGLQVFSALIALLFLYYYVRGIVGTIQYHKALEDRPAARADER